jgi:hypothetical protein
MDLILARPTKTCTNCKKEKSVEDFDKHRLGKYGRHSKCKLCTKEYIKKDRQAHPEKYKQKNLKAKLKYFYDLTFEQYQQMLKDQNGLCLGCGKSPKSIRLNVDHDHETGKVRGLLCTNCNSALGAISDNIEVLENLIRYIKSRS